MPKPLTVWMWGMACAPAAWLILFALFIVRARMRLGRWPLPYQPDPRDLGFDYHHTILVGGVPLVFAAVLTVTVLTVIVERRADRRLMIPLVALAGLAACILLAQLDPGFVFTWLAD